MFGAEIDSKQLAKIAYCLEFHFYLHIDKGDLMEKFKWFLYVSAVLLVGVPTLLVITSDDPYSSTFSNIVIALAFGLVILGKLIAVYEKRKENRRFSVDIGTIIGLSIAWILWFM